MFRSARAQAMGGAYTAVAEDDAALFYNPAGLAGVRGFSIRLPAVSAEASGDVVTGFSQFSQIFSGSDLTQLNQILGKNYSVRANTLASLTVPGFGVAALYDAQLAVRMKNQAYINGILGSQLTYGVQFGLGVPLFPEGRRKRHQLRLGVAGKVLSRAGGFTRLELTDLLTLNTSLITGRLQSPGMGYGVDLGLQYVLELNSAMRLMASVVARDLGNTSFSGSADPIQSHMVAGVGMKLKAAGNQLTLAYDYSRVFEDIDWGKKVHLGAEWEFALFRLSVGLNQSVLTYGAGLNLPFLSLMYLNTTEELSSRVGIDPENRHMILVSTKIGF